MRRLVIFAVALVLAACVTTPIPPDYTGPLAKVYDASIRETLARVQYFYLAEIDGKPIENAMSRMRKANSGRGFSSMATGFDRSIPARPMVVKLEGRIAYGAPIQELFMLATMYEANTYLEFSPEPNTEYTAVGELTENKRDVWLANAAGERVGKLVKR